ncbi:CU044_5270 family protein [Nonomuraea sp. NPDC026600]|uniref:CU044_5270 family protein n=1 Tax=Nonomuraea sp. NPDC026600 TaxID=3155363 RepID=UPI0033F38F08
MNELEMISKMLHKPDPSDTVVREGRRRLQNAQARPRRRSFVWLTGGMGLTAAAAAAVAVVVTTSGTPVAVTTGSPNGTPHSASAVPAQLSSTHILLAAASTAQNRADSGTYWHIKADHSVRAGKKTLPTKSSESWVRRDGQAWVPSDEGDTVYAAKGPKTFSLADNHVSFSQIEKLPTDPEALKAWIADKVDNGDGDADPAAREWFVANSLVNLLGDLPAPPEVRAAAFRALATIPIVKSIGTMKDDLGRAGDGLEISDLGVDLKVIIDPETSLVVSRSYRSGKDGKIYKEGTTTVRVSEWTDTLPPVVPEPERTGPARG